MRAALSLWKVKKTALEMIQDNKSQLKKESILNLQYLLELLKRDKIKAAIKQF